MLKNFIWIRYYHDVVRTQHKCRTSGARPIHHLSRCFTIFREHQHDIVLVRHRSISCLTACKWESTSGVVISTFLWLMQEFLTFVRQIPVFGKKIIVLSRKKEPRNYIKFAVFLITIYMALNMFAKFYTPIFTSY